MCNMVNVFDVTDLLREARINKEMKRAKLTEAKDPAMLMLEDLRLVSDARSRIKKNEQHFNADKWQRMIDGDELDPVNG